MPQLQGVFWGEGCWGGLLLLLVVSLVGFGFFLYDRVLSIVNVLSPVHYTDEACPMGLLLLDGAVQAHKV